MRCKSTGFGGEYRKRDILCYNFKEARRQKTHRKEMVKLLEGKLAGHKIRGAKAHNRTIGIQAIQTLSDLEVASVLNFQDILVKDTDSKNGCHPAQLQLGL